MEIRVILRGALSGVIGGVVAFVFATVFAEPVIDKAIDYESGREDVLAALNQAAGRTVTADGPEIFSRHVQSTVGIATGLIAFGAAMGALVAVAYLVLHGRFGIRPRTMTLVISGFGFAGVFLLPFVKYPAEPPAAGHEFTVTTRGHLYLVMVVGSLVLLGLAVFLGVRLRPRFGTFAATLLAGLAFLVPYGLLIGLLPSLGDLAANVAHQGQFGYGRSATETPQPIVNILSTPLGVDGTSIAPGQLAYPGFPADVLWSFRWYSLVDQVLLWSVTGLVFGFLLERFVGADRVGSRTDVVSGAV